MSILYFCKAGIKPVHLSMLSELWLLLIFVSMKISSGKDQKAPISVAQEWQSLEVAPLIPGPWGEAFKAGGVV